MKNVAEIMQAILDGKKITSVKWQNDSYLQMVAGDIADQLGNNYALSFLTPKNWKLWEEPKKKWEPKGGNYYLSYSNTVVKDDNLENHTNIVGCGFKTQKQAEVAAKLLSKYVRLLAYINEFAPEHDVQGAGYRILTEQDGKYTYWNHSKYLVDENVLTMPEDVAISLCDKLNSG